MGNNSFENTIKSYLDERSKTDELFAKSYAKSNKNLKECITYIFSEALKNSSTVIPGAKGCEIDNDVVYGMAVHYYDEDDIKVNKLPVSQGVNISSLDPIPIVLSEEDKMSARETAIQRLAEEQYALLKKKPAKAKKEATEVQQMSLF